MLEKNYRCTPKINFNIHSTKNNFSLENHSKSHRFDSRPTSYAFDNNSRKSNSLDDSTFSNVVQNPCGGILDNFVRLRYHRKSTGPQKVSLVIFLMGRIEFLKDEIKIKNDIIKRFLTLQSVLHDNQHFSHNSQQIKKLTNIF